MALAATAVVLVLPRLLVDKLPPPKKASSGRVAAAARFIRRSLVQGVQDGVSLLRQRSPGVLAGSFGTLAFDVAVLGACFKAFGHSPPFGVLVLGYLIGQLGGNLPVPSGMEASTAG